MTLEKHLFLTNNGYIFNAIIIKIYYHYGNGGWFIENVTFGRDNSQVWFEIFQEIPKEISEWKVKGMLHSACMESCMAVIY